MSMQDWTPNSDGLMQILHVLRNVQNPNNEIQRQIRQAIITFSKIPDYNRYLMFILVHMKDEKENVRTTAGILLKNNIKENPNAIGDNEQHYLKNEIVKAIGDPFEGVRRTCGTVISTIIEVGSIRSWPGIIQFLLSCLNHNDKFIVAGAFKVLERICEDHTDELNSEEAGRPVKILLPTFLSLFTRPEPEMRFLAINCVIKFIYIYPNEMAINKAKFIEAYFYLANDSNINVRSRAITAFILMAETHMADLKPYLPQVIEFILACMQCDNEDIALEATEMWKILANYTDVCDKIIQPLLSKIFPVILTKMMYSQQDLLDLGAEKEVDYNIEDKQKDIRPQFTTSVVKGHAHKENDSDEYDYASHWNIRKGSAEALDRLSHILKENTLPPLLPLFEQGFKSNNWLIRESCILGLGCIASGCSREMKPFLPNLVPYLFTLLSDEKPLIRSITCWTLGRYSEWICKQPDKNAYFNKLLFSLLERMQDQNKRVQKAATSGIAQVVESAQQGITPYVEAILQSFNLAFQKFQRGNMVVLYDAISTIAETIGSDLNREPYLKLLLPPLISKWESLTDNDTDLFPLLECLSYVAIALGYGFAPYAKPIYDRSLKLIESVLLGTAIYLQDDHVEPPNREFLICSLDLLSGLCEALKNNVDHLVNNSKLIPLLTEICKDTGPDYSQSCYALIGDLAKYAINTLNPALKDIIPLLINGFNRRFVESTNNAIWALGEIIMKAPQELIKPYAETIYRKVIDVFNSTDEPILETCAVTIGRLALFYPGIVAPHLKKIIKPLCIALRNLPDDEEKEDGLRGLCEAVKLNPVDILGDFQTFCDVITSIHDPPAPLRDLFGNILHSFKNQIDPRAWDEKIESFQNRIKNTLRNIYKV